jgi:CBS domain-containing protein
VETATLYKTDHAIPSDDGIIGDGIRLIDLIDEMCAGEDVFFHHVRVAADIMTQDPQTLTLDDTAEACLAFMRRNRVRHIPVVEAAPDGGDKRVLVAVVSGRDIGRHLSPYVGKLGQQDVDARGLHEPLAQFATRKPKSVPPEASMTELIGTMVENHIDLVPVVRDGGLAGIVTSTDILKLFMRIHKVRQLCEQKVPQKKMRLLDLNSGKVKAAGLFYTCFQTVEDVMTEAPVCLEDTDNLGRAIELMRKGKFRHLPVLDKHGMLLGIVSDRNVLRQLPGPRRNRAAETSEFRSGLFNVNPADPCLKMPVKQIMMAEVKHVPPNCTIYDAATMMHDLRIGSLAVTDETKKVRGIVTTTDLMRALLAVYDLCERQEPA